MPSSPALVRALAPLLLACAGACSSVGAKVWNLDQLHDPDTHHRYHAALENDIEYFLRHSVTSVLGSTGASLGQKDPSKVDNPAQRCLEYLVELEAAPVESARDQALQIEWCARLCVDDPSSLSRERAALILGPLGTKLEAGLPRTLSEKEQPAAAEAVAGAATALVRSVRGKLDPKSLNGQPALGVDEACSALEALVLDIDGARRALDAVGQLASVRGLDADSRGRLERCALELERRMVRQALARALRDKQPLVRAAAVQSSVQCGGLEVIDSILLQLDREPSPIVLVRVLTLVRTYGLPDPPAQVPENARANWRDRQLAALYSLLHGRAESEVHVAAMRALAKVSGAGLTSLREEDWQAWWSAHLRESKPAS